MSTLQLSLAIIGGLVLACIVAYNTWTSRRNAPRRALPPDPDRMVEPALRQEPGFDSGLAAHDPSAAAHAHPQPQPQEPGADPLAEHAVDPADALQMPVPAFSLDHISMER